MRRVLAALIWSLLILSVLAIAGLMCAEFVALLWSMKLTATLLLPVPWCLVLGILVSQALLVDVLTRVIRVVGSWNGRSPLVIFSLVGTGLVSILAMFLDHSILEGALLLDTVVVAITFMMVVLFCVDAWEDGAKQDHSTVGT